MSMRIFGLNRLFVISAISVFVSSICTLARAELNIVQLAQTDSRDEFFTVALGDDYAFWSHYNDGIYVWNTSNPINAGQKISDDKEVTVLSASGNKLAWIDDSDDIQVWDGTTIHEKEDDVVDTISLYEDNLAFVEEDNENFFHKNTEIFLRIPGEKIQITHNDYDDIQPSLYRHTLAWVGKHDGDNFDLFYWDGQNDYKLTDTDGDDLEPSLQNGAIAWTEYDGDDFEIYYWNGGANIKITDDEDDDRSPILRNGKIVWIKERGSCQDIYMWDGSQITQLTDRCYDRIRSLDFNGKAIIWSAQEDSEKSVYYAQLPGSSKQFNGWWYNPDEPGTGIATEIKGNKIFLTWFVYDQFGRTTWYSASGPMSGEDSFTGSLFSWTGWPWGEPYTIPKPEIVGTIVVILNEFPSHSITFTATIGNTVVTKTLKPFMADFAPGPENPRRLTGWWYDPAYDGMGFFLDARGGKMAMVWYNYREDGSSRWWTSDGVFEDDATTYNDFLDGWQNGQCPGCPYRLPSLIAGQGGPITMVFIDETHATCTVGDTTLHLQRFDF